MKNFLLKNLFAISLLITIPCRAEFPLDPLSSSELQEAADAIIVDFSNQSPNNHSYLLDRIELLEPTKQELLSERAPIARKAHVTIWNRISDDYLSYIYSFTEKKIVSSEKIKGARPSFTRTEMNEFAKLVKAHPDFIKSMQRRGISKEEIDSSVSFAVNLDGRLENYCSLENNEEASTCASCCADDEEGDCCQVCHSCSFPTPAFVGRSYYGVPFLDDQGKTSSFYPQPLDQVTAFVDFSSNRVMVYDSAKDDSELLPINRNLLSYDRGKRGTLKDLVTYQQNHNLDRSYTRDGHMVAWENWKFRFALHPRTGLVLYNVSYQDRPILYRASTNGTALQYGESAFPFKNHHLLALEGEHPYKECFSRLRLGIDVPPYAETLSTDFIDDQGMLYTASDALAIFEQDGGLLWRRFDSNNDNVYGRRGRQLVLTYAIALGSHDLGYYWIFNQDGSIDVQVKVTGQLHYKQTSLQKQLYDDAELAHGNLVEAQGIGINRFHTFNYRLDFDIDGQNNQVVEQNVSLDQENPCGTSWHLERTLLQDEQSSVRQINPQSYRRWIIENPNQEVKTTLGYNPGYALIPGTQGFSLANSCSRFLQNDNLFVTKYKDDELDFYGKYPCEAVNRHDGIMHYIADNEAITNEDIVVWYTMHGAAVAYPEDSPFISQETYSFSLKPKGFFTENQGLDIDKGRFVTRP